MPLNPPEVVGFRKTGIMYLPDGTPHDDEAIAEALEPVLIVEVAMTRTQFADLDLELGERLVVYPADRPINAKRSVTFTAGPTAPDVEEVNGG